MHIGVELDITLRLAAAAMLGGLVGLERERIHRAAGLRTHILVSVGSALFTLAGIYGFQPGVPGQATVDPSRIAAQIVSGIGFLGAGTIMRHGLSVRGLTTAASLWTVAGIGLACGAGFYFGAAATTAVVLVALVFLRGIERVLGDKYITNVELRMPGETGQMNKVQRVLEQYKVVVKSMELLTEAGLITVRYAFQLPKDLDRTKLIEELTKAGVTELEWEPQ